MGFNKFMYSVIGWLNKSESLTTPLGKLNLRHMDDGIKTIGDNLNAAYEELNTGKLDKDTAYTMVSDVAFDENTGIFTVTRLNGATFTIDTKLEKIITNWTFDKESQKMILTLDDGTKQEVDLSALITQYEFFDTDTIAFTIGSDGKVSANVKDGSILEKHLQPNYLTNIKTHATNASASAAQAADSADAADYDAKMAQSYAVGTGNMRDGESTDNAKYYKEQAKNSSDSASNSASSALSSSQMATTKANEAATSATNASKSEGNASTYATNASNSATSASSSATTATQKASEASASATNASNSANTATTKANEAKSSADAAALSESNALESETAAAQSESNAKTSESNASNSAKSANASATSASSSATTATNKATEAANSASDASDSANTAITKALEASSSASSASQSASSSATYSTKAQSYAVGGTGTRENEDTDNAEYYYQQAKSISESFSGALRPMGTVAFSNLPSVSSAAEGDMYNVSDEFTTTADFKEGSGLTIPAGSNVYKTADRKWDILAGSPVTGVKGSAESTYRKGNVNITPDNIGAVSKAGDNSNTTTTFTQATSRSNIATGEKMSVMMGKIAKAISDTNLIYSAHYNSGTASYSRKNSGSTVLISSTMGGCLFMVIGTSVYNVLYSSGTPKPSVSGNTISIATVDEDVSFLEF